ncbi:MAG: type II secretion system protein [Alteromonadaceae bacterium]|nr:type II secretion system protein [Alteromonadaceae bacterium]
MGINSRVTGFTLVELVMVIILIGVLSALGIGLFTRSSAFSPLLATQQLQSATLLAQQAALAGNQANELKVTKGSKDFIFTVGPDTPYERKFQIGHNGTDLSVNGTDISVNGASFPISFNNLGRPNTSGNVEFTFSGDSTFTVCLSSLGAVYGGGC